MKRALALWVLLGFAFAQTGDGFLQQLLGQLTDITGVLSVLKDRLELIQQGLLSLVPAVALLALLYGAFRTFWGGFSALQETFVRLGWVLALVALSTAVWVAAVGVWDAARQMGSGMIRAEAQQVSRDLRALGDTIGDFIVISYSLSVSSGRSERFSESQSDLSERANQAAQSNLAAVTVFNVLLALMLGLYFLTLLSTGLAVYLGGALFPFLALMVAFPGGTAVLWAGNFFKVFARAILSVLLVPLIFGWAFTLAIQSPTAQLRALVQEVRVQQQQLSQSVRRQVEAVADQKCDTACELLFKQQRDQLVDQLSGLISRALGMIRGVGIVFVVMLMGLLAAFFVLRSYRNRIADLLGGWVESGGQFLSRTYQSVSHSVRSANRAQAASSRARVQASQGTRTPTYPAPGRRP